jgi:hypothetical protein
MPSWGELDKEFQALATALRHHLVQYQWGRDGISYYLSGPNSSDARRFEILATIAGKKLDELPAEHRRDTIFARSDSAERWYEALRYFSGAFVLGPTGVQNNEAGEPEPVLFTGSVNLPAERSSVLALHLSSIAVPTDSSDGSVRSVGQSGGITAHTVSIVNNTDSKAKVENESVGPKGAEAPDLVKWFLWIRETSRSHPYWAMLAILVIIGMFLISPVAHSIIGWLSGHGKAADVAEHSKPTILFSYPIVTPDGTACNNGSIEKTTHGGWLEFIPSDSDCHTQVMSYMELGQDEAWFYIYDAARNMTARVPKNGGNVNWLRDKVYPYQAASKPWNSSQPVNRIN